MRCEKRSVMGGIELLNQVKIRSLVKKKTCKYLGILEANTKKQTSRDERTIKKECLRRMRKLLKTKLDSKNLITGIHTWVVFLVRYSGSFLKWMREELKQMDQKTRKLMTIRKTFHPRDDIDYMCQEKEVGD